MDWILLNIVASPTNQTIDSDTTEFIDENQSDLLFSTPKSKQSILDVFGFNNYKTDAIRSKNLSDLMSFFRLCDELKRYRQTLDERERMEFDCKSIVYDCKSCVDICFVVCIV